MQTMSKLFFIYARVTLIIISIPYTIRVVREKEL